MAIIIVSWNVEALLRACLQALFTDIKQSRLWAEVWVVDNASQDTSVAMVQRQFPTVKLLVSQKNLGFAGGNNLALRTIGFQDTREKSDLTASSKPKNFSPTSPRSNQLPQTVLLLNPDTEVHPGALSTLHQFLHHTPQAGIAGAQLQYGDGSFQPGAFDFPGLWQLAIDLLPVPGRFIESRLNGRYPNHYYTNKKPFRIGHPLGAAMCVRREAIQQVGLLDEGYHMYVEEVDWSKRITKAGWQVYCVPTARVTHHSGQSSGQIKITSFVNLWRSRYRFYRQYYNPLKFWLARQLVELGLGRKASHTINSAQQGHISETERQSWMRAYQQVINIWHGIAE